MLRWKAEHHEVLKSQANRIAPFVAFVPFVVKSF
jgi:hypothetical protein